MIVGMVADVQSGEETGTEHISDGVHRQILTG